jgi:HSP20 family molecular chaperone IbpA
MTTLTIRHERPPAATFATPRASRGVDAEVPFRGGIDGSFAPAFEVREYADHFEFQVDVPGVRAADLAVFVALSWVTVSGRRRQPADPPDCLGYRTYERGFGRFWRSFHLSPSVTSSGARGELRDGVLALFVPKGGDATLADDEPGEQPTQQSARSPGASGKRRRPSN